MTLIQATTIFGLNDSIGLLTGFPPTNSSQHSPPGTHKSDSIILLLRITKGSPPQVGTNLFGMFLKAPYNLVYVIHLTLSPLTLSSFFNPAPLTSHNSLFSFKSVSKCCLLNEIYFNNSQCSKYLCLAHFLPNHFLSAVLYSFLFLYYV